MGTPGLEAFGEYIQRHSARFLIGGIFLAFWFQSICFWTFQAGIYSNIALPTSVYAPEIGWGMLVGPAVSIVHGLYPPANWKIWIYGILLSLSIGSACWRLPKGHPRLRQKQKFDSTLNLFTHVCIPALLLPSCGKLIGDLAGSVAIASVLVSLKVAARRWQALAVLIGIGAAFIALSDNFSRGQKFIDDCPVQVAVTSAESTSELIATGCWITSSKDYMILRTKRENGVAVDLVVPRRENLILSFMRKGKNLL